MKVETMTGYPVSLISQLMDEVHPANAYKPIAGGVGASRGWSDLDPDAVRARLDMVFGMHGFGWRLLPVQGNGRTVQYEKDKPNGKGRTQVVFLDTWKFEYRVKFGDTYEWLTASAFGGSDENDELPYAQRGAFTNLMKHAVKNFGGFVHMTSGVFDHKKAERGNHPDAWWPGTLGKIGKSLITDYAKANEIALENLGAILGLAKGVKTENFPGDVNDAKGRIDDYLAKGMPELVQADAPDPQYVPDVKAIASAFAAKAKETWKGITKDQILSALDVKQIVDWDWINREQEAYELVQAAMSQPLPDDPQDEQPPKGENITPVFTGSELIQKDESAKMYLFKVMKDDAELTPKEVVIALGGKQSFREDLFKGMTLAMALEKLKGG